MTARAPRMLHMMIRVMDLEKTVHFYTELLGMKVIRKRDNPLIPISFLLMNI